MGQLITIALSNLSVMLLTAWILHRFRTGQSPLPRMPSIAPREEDFNHEAEEQEHRKGRPLV